LNFIGKIVLDAQIRRQEVAWRWEMKDFYER
jgi:hypothetical protein